MPTDPEGMTVRNLVALQRLANGMAEEVRRADLVPLFNEIIAQIARLDPGSDASRALREAQLREIMEGVQEISDEAFARLLDRLDERLTALGVQQGRWSADELVAALGPDTVRAVGITIRRDAVVPEFIRSVLEEDPFEGKVLADWVATQNEGVVKRVRRQVQLGMANGETLGDIVRRVRGTQRGGRFVGGVLEATTRETKAIVRTSINHVSNHAHMQTFEANEDILQGVESVAVLDSRTTLICASLDGVVWPIGSPKINRPPRHYNCRSVLQPVIDWDGLGVEPPEGARRPSKRYNVDDDGNLVETSPKQVPSSTTYEQWFRDQPTDVQNEIIGPSRARLFRSGKIDFRQMVTQDGTPINVSQLPGGEDALKAARGG